MKKYIPVCGWISFAVLIIVFLSVAFACSEQKNEATEKSDDNNQKTDPNSQASTTKPNVVILIVDDMGFADVGYHGSKIETPNIDKLAASGVKLGRFYATPLCGPTRKGLFTGRSPVSQGKINNPVPKSEDQSLPLKEHLISQSFKSAGYHTWIMGKWHLGGGIDPAYLPNNRGFDHFYGFVSAFIESYSKKTQSGQVDWQRNGKDLSEDGYSTDLLTDEAISLIEKKSDDKPFLLIMSYNAVHTPLTAPTDLISKYSKVFSDQNRQKYAAMAESLDSNIGRLLSALDKKGLKKDTLVFFHSDNGGNEKMGGASNDPFRGAKGQVYEGGIRVAAAAMWPGQIEAGSSSTQFFSVLDIFPTLASAAGIKTGNDLPFDGRNLWEQIRGKSEKLEPKEYLVIGNNGIAIIDSLDNKEWKLIEPNKGQKMLFDILNDESEERDVSSENSKVVESLSTKIETITKDVKDQL